MAGQWPRRWGALVLDTVLHACRSRCCSLLAVQPAMQAPCPGGASEVPKGRWRGRDGVSSPMSGGGKAAGWTHEGMTEVGQMILSGTVVERLRAFRARWLGKSPEVRKEGVAGPWPATAPGRAPGPCQAAVCGMCQARSFR